MSTIYTVHGKAGPWQCNDDGVVADGYIREGVLAIGPTCDGLELEVHFSRVPVGGLVNVNDRALSRGRDSHRSNP